RRCGRSSAGAVQNHGLTRLPKPDPRSSSARKPAPAEGAELAWQSTALRDSVNARVSKQRPSRRSPNSSHRAASRASRRDSAAFWRRRVFRNTYRRNGRTLRVNRWSVKVQHRGTRRTFSLAAPSRPQAAREAQSLCQTIRTVGWDAATQARQRNASTSIRQASGASRAGPTKSDARYWKERLVRRKYMEARMTRGNEFSVRIEHGGIDHYFPLGTDDVERAAAQALAIYRSIVTQGWEAAFEQFSREITVAVFWSTSPVACTYTTLFTFAG